MRIINLAIYSYRNNASETDTGMRETSDRPRFVFILIAPARTGKGRSAGLMKRHVTRKLESGGQGTKGQMC